MPTTLTVVLAEDSPLMRDGLTGVLNRFGHQVLAAVTLRRAHPDLPVLVLSQYIEQSYAAHLLNRRRDPLERLSPREREVLALMAEGHANAEIARELYVTDAAVNKHIGSPSSETRFVEVAGHGYVAIMFSLTVSRVLTVADVSAAFVELVPPGLRLVVQPDEADIPDDTGDLWIRLVGNEDPAWPLSLDVLGGYDRGLGPYPDLRVAEHLGARHGVDVLCGVDPAVSDVDPLDPYYRLALVGGRWHLASTAGTRLMGPYTVCDADGFREEPGDEPVKLIRPVVVDTR